MNKSGIAKNAVITIILIIILFILVFLIFRRVISGAF